MQHFRANLTRLKSQMENKLPEGNDIFGYSGVNKPLLISAVELAYSLSQEIEERDDSTRFEVIALKRHGSEANRLLKEYLDNQISHKKAPEYFNEFLNCLSSLIEKIKIAYFVVTKNGLRDDVELASIKAEITDLRQKNDELKVMKEELQEKVITIQEGIEAIAIAHQNAKSLSSEMAQWHSSTKTQFDAISETHDSIEGWDNDIKEHETKFQTLSQKTLDLSKETQNLKDAMESHVRQCESSGAALRNFEKENVNLQKEIQETLGDANRVGMAASFQERKKELASQQIGWQSVFIITIIIIVGVANFVVVPEIVKKTRDWNQILGELAIISPLIWLGWFAAKQYTYISRIREDYAFKFAASMAYEGHKKATREVDPDLERVLLEFSLFNMSQNPIRLYSKQADHATPLHEVASTILDKLPSLKKISGQSPSLGRFEMETEPKKKKEESGRP